MKNSDSRSTIKELDALFDIIQWLENREISDLEEAKKNFFVGENEVSHWISKADFGKGLISKKNPPLRLWKRFK